MGCHRRVVKVLYARSNTVWTHYPLPFEVPENSKSRRQDRSKGSAMAISVATVSEVEVGLSPLDFPPQTPYPPLRR